VLLVALFAAGWAFVETSIGRRVRGEYDLLQIVWSRYAVHLLLVLVIWGRRDPLGLWRTQRPGFHLARSLMMLIMPWSFATSLQSGLSASGTWLLFWSSPLLIILLGRLFCRESPAWWSWVLAVVTWGGVAMIVGGSLPVLEARLLLPGLMAVSFSAYVVMTRSLRDEPLRVNMVYTATAVFVLLSLRMPFVWVMPSMHDAVLFAGIGSFGLLALLALDRAVAGSALWVVAPGLAIQAAMEPGLSVLESGQIPGGHALAGMLLLGICLLLAGALPSRRPVLMASAG